MMMKMIMMTKHFLVDMSVCVGRNIYRQLFSRKLPDRNELFLPGRMAYVVDLEDDFTESDIPTTLIRSKADCPSLEVCHLWCSFNDMKLFHKWLKTILFDSTYCYRWYSGVVVKHWTSYQ